MKVGYVTKEEIEKKYIQENLKDFEIIFIENLEEEVNKIKDVEILSVFVDTKVSKDIMDKLPNLKFIATRSTGFDHIDTKEAKRRKMEISNVPSYGENTVAEFTFALLLSLSKKIYDSYNRIAETGSFSQDGLMGFDLNEKTIGVIGTGKIGMNVIKIAKGFNMNILAYDPFPKEKEAKKIGFKYKNLEDVLKLSDIITLHAPYNKETHHIINMKTIKNLKNGSFLINTARGGLIETKALVYALKKKIVAGAGLDVLEEEGYMSDELSLLNESHPNLENLKISLSNHYLIDHPRVLITPHNAFNTKEAINRIIETTKENIKSWIKNKPINTIK